MKKMHSIYLTSFITVATVLVINKIFSNNCPQIDIFRGDSLFQLLKFLGNVILGLVIWIIGFKMSKKLKLEKNKFIFYFVILSLISTSFTLKKLWESNVSSSRELIKSICDKSRDDGMEYKAENMTSNEYNYLIKDSGWLPISPPNANHINIGYYRDEFLGDYALNVEIELPKDEPLDSLKYPKWKKIEANKYRFGGYQD